MALSPIAAIQQIPYSQEYVDLRQMAANQNHPKIASSIGFAKAYTG